MYFCCVTLEVFKPDSLRKAWLLRPELEPLLRKAEGERASWMLLRHCDETASPVAGKAVSELPSSFPMICSPSFGHMLHNPSEKLLHKRLGSFNVLSVNLQAFYVQNPEAAVQKRVRRLRMAAESTGRRIHKGGSIRFKGHPYKCKARKPLEARWLGEPGLAVNLNTCWGEVEDGLCHPYNL